MMEGRITQHTATKPTLNIGAEVHTNEMSSYLEPLKAKMVDLMHWFIKQLQTGSNVAEW